MSWQVRYAALRFGPWLVFAATVALVGWLFVDQGRTGASVGFAVQIEAVVAPSDSGRLLAITVEPGDEVREGDVVAQLDPSVVDAEVAVMRAERARLALAVHAERAATERSVRSDLRQLEQRSDALEVELRRDQARLARAKGEVKALRAERRRLGDLVDSRLVTRDASTEVELRFAVAQKEARELPAVIALLESQIEHNHAERTQLADVQLGEPSTDSDASGSGQIGGAAATAAAPLAEQLKVVDRKLDALRAHRERLTLRAPTTGHVVRVDRRPGEVVRAAEPVVRIVMHSADRVSACLPEAESLRVQLGERVRLLDRSRQESGSVNSAPSYGTVISIGPVVDELPPRCWRTPSRPQWGRTALVRLDEARGLIPGQAFDVAFLGARSTGGTAIAAEVRQGNAAEILPMQLPRRLTERSRIEPSGAVWDESFQRYLVASDDTGLVDHHEHVPWLFSVSREGAFDVEPLPIVGINKVRDLEALSWDRSGRLLALSSSSMSKSGKRKASRCGLLALRVASEEAHVVGQVNLFGALSNLSTAELAALGLGHEGDDESVRSALSEIDFEGMTSYEAGLLVGLKSPVDSSGRALIWHIRSPDVLFEQGDLRRAGIEVWARVSLSAPRDGTRVVGGISDLLGLSDGRIVVASTPSTGDGEDGGVVSVLSRAPGGATVVRELHEFAGLKPEGLASSARSSQISVFFDRGDDPPTWTEIPWPR